MKREKDVVDVAADSRAERIIQVENVLREIGAASVPTLLVYNKVDINGGQSRIDRDASGKPVKVWLSAHSGDGLDFLLSAMGELLADDLIETQITLAPHEGNLRAKLFALGAVLHEDTDPNGCIHMDLRIDQRDLTRIQRQELIK